MEKQKPKDIYIVIGNIDADTGELKREDAAGVTKEILEEEGVSDRNGYERIL
jgi:hypothetical protein